MGLWVSGWVGGRRLVLTIIDFYLGAFADSFRDRRRGSTHVDIATFLVVGRRDALLRRLLFARQDPDGVVPRCAALPDHMVLHRCSGRDLRLARSHGRHRRELHRHGARRARYPTRPHREVEQDPLRVGVLCLQVCLCVLLRGTHGLTSPIFLWPTVI